MVQILKNGELLTFGQEQIPYDISKVKDETLHTCKITVESDELDPLEPSTILLLDNEYWYVDGDKCVYRANQKCVHNINLVELTQILNDRFVEDCKFAQNRYTYESGIDRLLKLSNSKDIKVKYDDLKQEDIDFAEKKYEKPQEQESISFPIYTITNLKEDEMYELSGEYTIDVGGEIQTKDFNVTLQHNSTSYIYKVTKVDATGEVEQINSVIEVFWYNNVIGISMNNYTSTNFVTPSVVPIETTIKSISLLYSNRNVIMPTFQFQDTNLYNALESICVSLGVKPRLRYNDGLELYFMPIGANDIVHNFSEIEDIEIIKEYSRNSNAKSVLSNCKNISGDEYVWFPSQNYGKALLPDDNGTTLQQSDKAVFKLNSNVKDIKKVRVFPYIEMWVNNIKYFSGYFDVSFYNNFVIGLQNGGISSSKAREYTAEIISRFYDGNGIYVDIEEGGKVSSFNSILVTNDIFEIDSSPDLSALREKKKYDLLNHKYVFDRLNIDDKEKSLYWEQNQDYIKGFNGLLFDTHKIFNDAIAEVTVKAYFDLDKVMMSAYYLPQTDIRLVTNNNCNFDITKQYNQSGKMIDYYNTKKDIQNYIDTMESKDVIVTKLYNNKEDIYNVGDKLYDELNDKMYIITNCSIKVLGGNYYDVIYQLNENHIRRSEFISADSDIRDYNIPITNLVDRSKTFKDKLVFSYTRDKYDCRIPVYSAINVFYTSGKYFINDESDNVANLQSPYDIAIIKCKYSNNDEATFTLPTTIISSLKNNSKAITIKIPDNYIIGWNYFVSYNVQNQFKPFFDGWGINGIVNASGKNYTPIRYTDLKGEIKDMQILLAKSCKIQKYDFDSYAYLNKPYLAGLYLTMPVGSISSNDGEFRDYYDLVNNYVEDVIRIDVKDLLKDRYETLSFTEEIEYSSDDGIELGSALSQEGNNELFYNRIESTRLLRLYDKEKYKYITNTSKLGSDYYKEITLQEENINADATGRITIDLNENIDFSKYNIVIVNRDNELIIALNNYSNEIKHYITLFLNGYKY